jgi:four helix bundle protein
MEQGLESLKVWKISVDFVEKIYQQVLPTLPDEEKYSLNQQIRRAVQSIPANIAEGYGRYYFQEGIRFCYIARGSLEEVRNFMLVCKRLDFINEDLAQGLNVDLDQIAKMLNGYIAYLKQSKRGINEPGSQIRENTYDSGYEIQSDTK